MNHLVAFLNGEFIPESKLALPVDDLGIVQGVAVSERLRTFRGQLFRLSEHLDRLANSLSIIDVQLGYSLDEIGQIARGLIDRNSSLLEDGDDFGLSLFVTPGVPAVRQPTICIHCYPLPFGQWVSYYTAGQILVETGIRQVPASCWPTALKCRSRMHYYLADKLAQTQLPGARAILLDQDNCVSEASTANVVFFNETEGIVSPSQHRILPGVSLSALEELATSLDIPMSYRDFQIEELAAADEILLCSTSPCVWPVTQLNEHRVGDGGPGPVFRRLLSAWSELVGVDIAEQAKRFAHRHVAR